MRVNLFLVCFLWICHLTGQGVKPGFIENKGQWDSRIRFLCPLPNGMIAIENHGIRHISWDDSVWKEMVAHPHHQKARQTNPSVLPCYNYFIRFKNGLEPNIIPENKEPYYLNYFIGNQPHEWAGHVNVFRKLTLKNVWPGIDWDICIDTLGLKSNFKLNEQANPHHIKLTYEGVNPILNTDGSLQLQTPFSSAVEKIPYGEWNQGSLTTKIPVKYEIGDQEIRYVWEQKPDGGYLQLIDPLLIFSTYSGSTVDNFGFTATYDSKGSLIAGGIASWPTRIANGRYPATPGAFQVSFGGGNSSGWEFFPCDISISKYTPDGDSLIYATYLGGTQSEFPHSIVVDSYDQLIVFGSTTSTNFPVKSGSIDTTHNGQYDMILTKFNDDGSALVGSTYIGGNNDDGFKEGGTLKYNYADEFRGEVDVDRNGNIYIASCTESADFPVSTFAPQTQIKGNIDAVILKIDSQVQQIKWSSYWGGDEDDAFYSIEVSPDDSVITAGGGTSSDSLFTDSLAYQKDYAGGRSDGYIIRLSNDSLKVQKATYLGTSQYNQIYFIEQDIKGRIYATGQTVGNWPVVGSGVFNQDPGSGQFICRLDAGLSSLEKSICFGSGSGKPDVNPSAFMVDYCENVYFSGWGSDVAGPGDNVGSTSGLKISGNAIQTTTDGQDFYLTVFSKNLSSRLYATYFGSSGQPNESGDHVDGGTSRFDPKGIVYQSVCSSCPMNSQMQISNFPTSSNAFSTTNPSPRCSNASFKIDFQISSAVIADFTVGPSSGCFPTPFQIVNKSSGGKAFYWDFGDGNQSQQKDPTHTYAKGGKFTIRLIVTDSNSCNVSDTAYRIVDFIEVPQAKYVYKIDTCKMTLEVANTASKAINTYWDWGDTTYSYADQTTHQYRFPGTYSIMMINGKNFPCADTARFQIVIPDVKAPEAIIQASVTAGCPPFTVTLSNLSTNFKQSIWTRQGMPDDSNTTSTFEVTKKGRYRIILYVFDLFNCNKFDADTVWIEGFDESVPKFKSEVDLCEQKVKFKDESIGAFKWEWDFGDQSSLDTNQNPEHIYTRSGKYTVRLTINKGQPCEKYMEDTLSFLVFSSDSFLIPNVFTPNGDGLNDCFQPGGYNPYCIELKIWIYNRWGQLVYRSEDPNFCWDGEAMQGGHCPDGTYFYILERKSKKTGLIEEKGTITLLGN